jgi:hypothetical protein
MPSITESTEGIIWPVGVAAQVLFAGITMLAATTPTRTARLNYGRGPSAPDCPDVDVIRAGVTARLGYDPFDDRGELLIVATVNRSGRTLDARIQISGAAGKAATTERKLVSRQNDCLELASAMELAISIAIDPLAGTHPRSDASVPPPVAPPAPAVIVVREEARPPAPAPSPPASTPIGFQVRMGGLGTVGSAPGPAVGGTVQVSAHRGSFSIGLEGRGDLPQTTELILGGMRVGDMQTSLVMGSLVPCASRRMLEGCALLSGGAIRASARDLVNPQQVNAMFLAVGARVALELPLGSSVSAGVHVDVLAPITELVLRVSGRAVWTSPPISGALGLTLGAHFP